MNEATTTKLLWTTAACSPRSAASNTFYPNMFPSFPAGKFPLISTHSAYPRAPDPLFASHPLNHAVQAAVPFVAVGASADALAKRIEKELAGTELFYYVVKCSLLDLLDGGFVGAHVANAGAGELLVVSHGTSLDVHDCVAVSSGLLTLSLTKDTFETFGLVGKKGAGEQRWIVDVDLKGEYRPGTKMWDRLRWCLEHNFQKEFELIVAFYDGERPLEIAFPQGINATKRIVRPTISYRPGILIPPFLTSLPPEDTDLLEWLGMLFAGSPQLDAYEREDPYVSIYRINDGQTGAALAVTWRGLFPSAVAAKLAEKLKDLAGRLDEVPWTACVTHGFRDSPVSFHGSQLARDGPGLSFVCLTASEDGTWTAYETGR